MYQTPVCVASCRYLQTLASFLYHQRTQDPNIIFIMPPTHLTPSLSPATQIKNLTLKIQGQGHSQGQTWADIEEIPYLTLQIQGQGHNKNQPKLNQVINWPTIMPKIKEIGKGVRKLLHEPKSDTASSGWRHRTNL